MLGSVEKPKYKPPAWCALKEIGRCYLWEEERSKCSGGYQMEFYEKQCSGCSHRIQGNEKKYRHN